MTRPPLSRKQLRAAASVVCSTFALLFAAPVWPSHVGESLNVDQQLITANNQLLAALSQWQKAPRTAARTSSRRRKQLRAAASGSEGGESWSSVLVS